MAVYRQAELGGAIISRACAFCGKVPTEVRQAGGGRAVWCAYCEITGPVGADDFGAAARWNRLGSLTRNLREQRMQAISRAAAAEAKRARRLRYRHRAATA